MTNTPGRRTAKTDPSVRLARALEGLRIELTVEEIAQARADYRRHVVQHYNETDFNRWVDYWCQLTYADAIRAMVESTEPVAYRVEQLRRAYALVKTADVAEAWTDQAAELSDDDRTFRDEIKRIKEEKRTVTGR